MTRDPSVEEVPEPTGTDWTKPDDAAEEAVEDWAGPPKKDECEVRAAHAFAADGGNELSLAADERVQLRTQ